MLRISGLPGWGTISLFVRVPKYYVVYYVETVLLSFGNILCGLMCIRVP